MNDHVCRQVVQSLKVVTKSLVYYLPLFGAGSTNVLIEKLPLVLMLVDPFVD